MLPIEWTVNVWPQQRQKPTAVHVSHNNDGNKYWFGWYLIDSECVDKAKMLWKQVGKLFFSPSFFYLFSINDIFFNNFVEYLLIHFIFGHYVCGDSLVIPFWCDHIVIQRLRNTNIETESNRKCHFASERQLQRVKKFLFFTVSDFFHSVITFRHPSSKIKLESMSGKKIFLLNYFTFI